MEERLADSGEKIEGLDAILALVKDKRYAEAEASARKLLTNVEAERGRDAPETGRVLDVVVSCIVRQGKAKDPEVRTMAERAEAIREKSPESLSPDRLSTLRNLGEVHWLFGRYQEARPVYEKLVALHEQVPSIGSPDLADDILVLGNILLELNDYSGARRLYERALDLRRERLGADNPEVTDILYNIAMVYRRTGEFQAALPLYETVLARRKKELGEDSPDLALILNGYGVLRYDMGDYAGAGDYYRQALELREKAPAPDELAIARTLNNLAVLGRETGNCADAIGYLEKALEIRERKLPPDHPEIGKTINNLAVCHAQQKDAGAALPLFERATKILEKALGPEHPQVSSNLLPLADLLLSQRQYDRARSLYERALRIDEKSLPPNHPELAWCLNGLGVVQERSGDYAGARQSFERALKIRQQALGPEHPLVAVVLNNLGRQLARAGDPEGAARMALQAEEISRHSLTLTARTLPEREALLYATVRTSGLDLALSVASRSRRVPEAPEVLDAVIRSRALVLDEMASRHRSYARTDDPEVESLVGELALASRQLAALVLRGRDTPDPAHYRALFDRATEEQERVERELARKSEAFRREATARSAGLQEVAGRLPARSALVSYVVYHSSPVAASAATAELEEAYLAVILRSGQSQPVLVPLGREAEISPLVQSWRREAARGATAARRPVAGLEHDYRAAGEKLRRRIWDPLVPELGGSKTVFVVPDGAINLVSLEALPVGGDAYLIEKEPVIHYLSAERDLLPKPPGASEGRGLLAVGGPSFDTAAAAADLPVRAGKTTHGGGGGAPEPAGDGSPALRSGCADLGSLKFGPLPESIQETRDVARLWRKAGDSRNASPTSASDRPGPAGEAALVLTGANASEAAFKREAPGRRMLHLATHGFFLGADCSAPPASSRGIGGLAPAASSKPAPWGLVNPLLLSGLALAGANRRGGAARGGEDGILTAEEIADMDLEGVEWAVLSACDTGVGEVKNGEGVFGLRRAFQVAGADNVIMSLWAVDDAAAREWMRSLYQEKLVEHRNTTESIRQAGLQMLRRRRASRESTHPFAWGGWVGVGN
jgi:tetratricopeptide (TPR) repeat protein